MEYTENRICKKCGVEIEDNFDTQDGHMPIGGSKCKCKIKTKISLDEALRKLEEQYGTKE